MLSTSSAVNNVNRVNDVNDVRKTRRRRRRPPETPPQADEQLNAAAGGLPPKTPPQAAGVGVLTSLTRLTSLT
jgi:hypothetical protein